MEVDVEGMSLLPTGNMIATREWLPRERAVAGLTVLWGLSGSDGFGRLCCLRFRHGFGRERKVRWGETGIPGFATFDDDEEEEEAGVEEGKEVKGGKGEANNPFEGVFGKGNVFTQYEGGFQYGARHGADTSTITFFYTLLGDYYQGTPVNAKELLYANGDRYRGSVAATYYTGQPAADLYTTFGDGSDATYEGCRYDNTPVPNGEGVMTFADGATHTGHFVCGRAHGLGRYEGVCGEVVEGEFVNGYLHGPGRFELGAMQEVGAFENGQLQGQGLRLFKDKYLHEGCFEKGELHR